MATYFLFFTSAFCPDSMGSLTRMPRNKHVSYFSIFKSYFREWRIKPVACIKSRFIANNTAFSTSSYCLCFIANFHRWSGLCMTSILFHVVVIPFPILHQSNCVVHPMPAFRANLIYAFSARHSECIPCCTLLTNFPLPSYLLFCRAFINNER